MKKLKTLLESIDHKGYPAYKSLKGVYQFASYQLQIEKVQGDPFASPSRVVVLIRGGEAGFPQAYYQEKHCRIALEDHILRLLASVVKKYSFKAKGSGKSGLIAITSPGQEVIERSACQVDPQRGDIRLCMSVGFPANGRSIHAGELYKILFQYLPDMIDRACLYKNISHKALEEAIYLAEDQMYIRSQMEKENLIAFVANGSILPRENGVSQRPMKGAIPFCAPKSMEVTWCLPHKGTISGMGIPKGITLIVGGGYHGKSTLLQTLEKGVYPHVQGDGREYVLMDASAAKIRSEDGRRILHKDISPFIRNLPNGKDTKDFVSEDASGSTSQAANVVEAVECGSKVLLIDEDTSATNFMIRDQLMEEVVAAGDEPIMPFIRRVTGLYQSKGVSTILVAGSCGAFFHVAHKILQMDNYQPKEITEYAKRKADAYPLQFDPQQEGYPEYEEQKIYIPKLQASHDRRNTGFKIKTMGTDGFSINKCNVDMRYMEQITDSEQMLAIARALANTLQQYAGQKIYVSEVVKALSHALHKKGLSALGDGIAGDMAMPRAIEIAGCINRYRGFTVS